MGELFNKTLDKSATLKDWTYIQAEPGCAMDFTGMDGMLFNMKTGEIRPVDCKADALQSEKPIRAMIRGALSTSYMGNIFNAAHAEPAP